MVSELSPLADLIALTLEPYFRLIPHRVSPRATVCVLEELLGAGAGEGVGRGVLTGVGAGDGLGDGAGRELVEDDDEELRPLEPLEDSLPFFDG